MIWLGVGLFVLAFALWLYSMRGPVEQEQTIGALVSIGIALGAVIVFLIGLFTL